LEKRAEQDLSGSKGGGGKEEGVWDSGGEMAQTIFIPVNKRVNNKKRKKEFNMDREEGQEYFLWVLFTRILFYSSTVMR
jgi:hypothetical protein